MKLPLAQAPSLTEGSWNPGVYWGLPLSREGLSLLGEAQKAGRGEKGEGRMQGLPQPGEGVSRKNRGILRGSFPPTGPSCVTTGLHVLQPHPLLLWSPAGQEWAQQLPASSHKLASWLSPQRPTPSVPNPTINYCYCCETTGFRRQVWFLIFF